MLPTLMKTLVLFSTLEIPEFIIQHFQIVINLNKISGTALKTLKFIRNFSSITCLKTFAGISTTFIVIYNIIYIVLMFHANDLEPYQYFGILECKFKMVLQKIYITVNFSKFGISLVCYCVYNYSIKINEKGEKLRSTT